MADAGGGARPLSPTPFVPEELAYDLHHLVEHNHNTPPYVYESQMHVTPSAAETMSGPYGTSYGHGYSDDTGLGPEFNGLSAPQPGYYGAIYSHSSSPYVQSSPPTPQSTASDVGVRTRSGRKIGPSHQSSQSRTSSKARRSKSPRPTKKSKSAKSDKLKIPRLSEPISVLTKDVDVPVKDMEAWVNRPVEIRLKQLEKRKGYVTRPMNSFMLYRSAYAERVKQWGVHNNHQIVSSMAGESWPLEPPEIREYYTELAKIERTNHHNAHPDYKFSPSKTGGSKKRKEIDYDSEEEESTDVDDPDPEWGAHRRQQPKRRQLDDAHLNISAPFVHQSVPSNTYLWDAGSNSKPLPQAVGAPYVDYRYYQPPALPQYAMSTIDELRAHQMEHHGMLYPVRPHQPLVGLPAGPHQDVLRSMPANVTLLPHQNMQVDPSFSGYESGLMNDIGVSYDASVQQHQVASDFLGTGQGDWHVDPSLQLLETGTEFEKWMDDETRLGDV